MTAYTERTLVQTLVPLLIARLPDPFSPTDKDMLKVATAAGRWADKVANLRGDPRWQYFLLDKDGEDWNAPVDDER